MSHGVPDDRLSSKQHKFEAELQHLFLHTDADTVMKLSALSNFILYAQKAHVSGDDDQGMRLARIAREAVHAFIEHIKEAT